MMVWYSKLEGGCYLGYTVYSLTLYMYGIVYEKNISYSGKLWRGFQFGKLAIFCKIAKFKSAIFYSDVIRQSWDLPCRPI